MIELVEDSVQVDGKTAQYTYNDVTGELTVVLETIETGANAVITFQVQKV